MTSPQPFPPSALEGQSCLIVQAGRWSIAQQAEIAGETLTCTRASGATLTEALAGIGARSLASAPVVDFVGDLEADSAGADTTVHDPDATATTWSLTPLRACGCSGACGACRGTGLVPQAIVVTVIDPAGEVLTEWVDPRDLPVQPCRVHAHCWRVLPAAAALVLIGRTTWGPHNAVALTGTEVGWAGLQVGTHVRVPSGHDVHRALDLSMRASLGGVDADGDWAGGPWEGVGVDDAGRVVSLTVRLIARTDAQAALARASHTCAFALTPQTFGEDTHWTLYRADADSWIELAGGWDIDEVMHAALVHPAPGAPA